MSVVDGRPARVTDGRPAPVDHAGPPADADDASPRRIPRPRPAPPPHDTMVLAAVGTDSHPFNRLMDWLEEWYADMAGQVGMVVQYGRSRPPAIPGAVDFLDHAELQRAMARAAVVVCHGGPVTILEARQHGHLPIVVPRDPRLREHVDDHQLRFVRRLAAAGMVALCESRESLATALGIGVCEPAAYAVPVDRDRREAEAAVAHVGRVVEELIAAARQRRVRRWWRR